MGRQPAWDQYEVALLIEAYINIQKNPRSKNKWVQSLSHVLREYAISQGRQIDPVYRNENGINLRLSEIHYLFATDNKGITKTSRLFSDMVDLYIEDMNEFKSILMEAKRRISDIIITESEIKKENNNSTENKVPDIEPANGHEDNLSTNQYSSCGGNNENRHFIREDKEQFYRWLINKKGLSEESAARVVRVTKQAEDYAKEDINSNCKLLSGSSSEIVETIERLSQDDEFIRRNYMKNGKPFKAIRLFVEFVEKDHGDLKFSKNTIIYKQCGRPIVQPKSPLRSWTVYKRDSKKSRQNEQDGYSIESINGHNTTTEIKDAPGDVSGEIQVVSADWSANLDNTEKGYSIWLKKIEFHGETSCKRHVDAVLIAERYALMNDYYDHYEHRLFGSDSYNAREIVNRVLEDDRFVKTYNTYISALKKYRTFLEYIVRKKDEEDYSDSFEKDTYVNEVITQTKNTFANTNSEKQYRIWLNQNNILGKRSKKFIEAVYIAERYAILNDFSPYKLFEADNSSAASIVNNLLGNEQFLKTYESYKYALRMYLRFLNQFKSDHNQDSAQSKIIGVEASKQTEKLYKEDSVGIRNDDDIYRLKYPIIYSELSKIAETYYRPNGMTVKEICRMIGISDRSSVIEVLEHVSWANKDDNSKRYVLQHKPCREDPNYNAQDNDEIPKSGNETNSCPSIKETHDAKTEILDFKKEHFIDVLMSRYKSGMLFDSIDLDIFRDTYRMMFDEELTYDNASLVRRLRKCGVIYKDRLFPAEGVIDNDTKVHLFEYIDSSFSAGNKVIYYKAIFEDLADDFANCYALVDEEMLHAYLEYSADPGVYYFSSKYISKEKHVTIDPTIEVENFLLSSGKPVDIESVCSALSHIPNEQIIGIIHSDHMLLRNAKGEYYHIDIFEISESELKIIIDIINEYISVDEYAIWNDVWNAIRNKMPVFIENNPYLSSLGVRNAVARYCSDKFNFGASVISLPGKNYRMWDIYQLYAKHHHSFSAEEIYHLSKELDTAIYFDAIAEVSVRVSYDKFVSKELISFDTNAIDEIISSFMSKDYIRIREIDSFIAFPNVGYEWNEYLLESFLLSYSKKHKLLNNGLSLNNVAGVIVRREGKTKTFVDACAAVLADGNIELKKDAALTYLAEKNMITRRSYKDINEAIDKAYQIRLRGRN